MMSVAEKKKYRKSTTPFGEKGIQKESEINNLKQFDDHKMLRPLHRARNDASRTFLTNLIYMVDLADTLQMIIPFYWNPRKTILDVTSGKRIIWKHFLYNHLSACGYKHWDVEFNDISPEAQADYHIPAQKIESLNKRWDIGVCDFPFTELKNGVESFAVRAKKISGRIKTGAHNQKFSRDFYFRGFRPLKEVFAECVKPFNNCFDNLIVKMGDSHKNKVLVSNVTAAELAFSKEYNPESEFNLIDRVGYRGNYARRGGRFPFAQSVMSYYLIFKKNPDSR